MAGEIQLNSTTMATESSGTITLSNVNSATNRTNLGLGSIATQAADNVSISGGNITGGTIGSSVNIKAAINASGSAPIYACRAWVNFNGTGTVAIRASGNVSSITDNGTGDYTVNFTTAMPDANYCAVRSVALSGNVLVPRGDNTSASQVNIYVTDTSNTPTDPTEVHVSVFR